MSVRIGRRFKADEYLMSRYSLYAYEEEIRQGFLTVEGGHRIGVCGQVMQLNAG